MEEIKEKKTAPFKSDISKPEDFTDPDVLYAQLVETLKKFHPDEDIDLIDKAYKVAKEAHKDQKRKSGEPYIIHPVCVAIILAELHMDGTTVAAGILHDVVEDTIMTSEELASEFSPEIARLVDGVTKLTRLDLSVDKDELQAENMRKMFMAMANDIRVIMIKLADRLHNVRTLQYQSPAKQIEKARETMDIYAPIAHRLGISKIKIELDDISMSYLYHDVYVELKKEITTRLNASQDFINQMVNDVDNLMKENSIEAEVDGRVKHFFSIYKKMVTQGKTLDQIYDIHAVRIKVDSIKDCYAALGVIHEKYKPIPGRFKDYIAMPKANNYQSLHTTLIGPEGKPFEVQIRTYEMHRIAEYGIAAHWKYKVDGSGSRVSAQEMPQWMQQIVELQENSDNNEEFMTFVKTELDLFSDQVYVFTPAGDVRSLPAGSTPIDFAYMIHTAVGNNMIGARINGIQVPIETKLKTGDRVEIVTSRNSKGPSRDWLNIVKSSQAKTKINQWFRQFNKEDNINHGREAMISYCKSKQINIADINKPEYQETVVKKFNYPTWDALLAAIGHGGIREGQVVNRLLEEYNKEQQSKLTEADVIEKLNQPGRIKGTSKGGIIVKGMNDVAVRYSKCCSPVPGDDIVGYITRGRGISIHRTDCINVVNFDEFDRARLIEADWAADSDDTEHSYNAELNIYVTDSTGIVFEISRIFNEEKINITSIMVHEGKGSKATVNLSFVIHAKEQLSRVTSKIRALEPVIDIQRTTG